jgi:hypothetical protein
MAARIPYSPVLRVAMIAAVTQHSRRLGAVHWPLFPAAHESLPQTVVQVRRYRTDPDPLERHRVPFPGIGADPLPHSLHQSLHLMLPAQHLIFGRRGYLAAYLAANAQESQRFLAGR